MSPQDAKMLNDFLGQLVQARGLQKDAEADALIQRAVAQQPDAAYLLVQRSLLQQQALESAREQIAELQDQLQNQARGAAQDQRRFPDANAWGNSGGSRPADPRDLPQGQYQQPSMMGNLFGARSGGFLGGGGGFLSSVAATAAGVAAGSFLFHGLDNMFHHHEQGGSRLLNSGDQGNNLFSDQSGSSLAGQAGLGDIGSGGSGGDGGGSGQRLLDDGAGDAASEGLFDAGTDDSGTLDSTGGFFDGDGSDEGLFS